MPNQNHMGGNWTQNYGFQPQQPNFTIPMGSQTGVPMSFQPANQAPSMSIAAIRGGRLVAEQFPVAAGTELWLIDKEANKIYIKTNPMNPAEMREADFSFVEPQVSQDAPVSRAEFDELKSMLTKLGAMISENRGDKRNNRDCKRGDRHDKPDGVSANAE